MNRTSGFFPWLVWTLAALFVVFNYVQQVVPNVIAADLAHSFNATAGTLGNIAACYFYAYAILQIPVGLIVDRYGTRGPLTVAVLAAGLGTILFSQAHGPGMAGLARFIMGASAAFSFIGCLKVVQAWFPPSKFSTLAGVTNMAGSLGAATGPLVAVAVQHFSWRETVAWTGGAELLLAVLIFVFVRDNADTNRPAPESTTATGSKTGLLRNPQAWINATYAASISLVNVAFGGLWGTGYIQKVYSLDAIAANGAGSFLFFGGIAGSLFFGWISDYLGRRKPPMVLAAVGALISMICLFYIPGIPLIGFKVALFFVGVFISANIISYAVARDLYPKLAGFSIGFLSTCYFAASAASQPLVGLLLDHASSGADKIGGLAALTPGDYRYAFSPLVIFMVIGLLASLLLKETLTSPPRR